MIKLIELLWLFWIVHYAESAFTNKIPYFQHVVSKTKWYWDTESNRVRTTSIRNEIGVSFDEKEQIIYIGDSKCATLTLSQGFLRPVLKEDGCIKFIYRNNKLIVDQEIYANEVCVDPIDNSDRVYLTSSCLNYKLFFENVIELPDGSYVGADEGGNGGDDKIDSNTEATTATATSDLYTSASTKSILSQEIHSSPSIESFTTLFKSISIYKTNDAPLTSTINLETSISTLQSNHLQLMSSIHLSGTSLSTQNEKSMTSSVKPTSLQGVPIRSSTTYTTNNAALTSKRNIETSKLALQSNHPQLISSIRLSKASLTTRNNEAIKSVQPTKSKISNTKHFRDTKKIVPTASVKRSTEKQFSSTAARITENVSGKKKDWPHPVQPGVMSNYVMKGYYINECIFKQINNIDDTECFMKCLKISLCKSFTHSNKNRCIIYSCIIDKRSQNKVNTVDENHAYYQ